MIMILIDRIFTGTNMKYL